MPLAALFERGENCKKFKQILNDLWARTHDDTIGPNSRANLGSGKFVKFISNGPIQNKRHLTQQSLE